MNAKKDFPVIGWNADLEDDCRHLVRLAIREDLGQTFDWTTLALVPAGTQASAQMITRQVGVLAGIKAVEVLLDEAECAVQLTDAVADGSAVTAGHTVARLTGSARDILTLERLALDFVGHLSGIATLTQRFVDAVRGTKARIYDTRKTIPGWRRLEKYAVACGGGCNHRLGLNSGILIKDNHLVLLGRQQKLAGDPGQAVNQARQFLQASLPDQEREGMIIEVEVDALAPLASALGSKPDIVLLDNMTLDQLEQAIRLRDQLAPTVELEASGGVTLDAVRAIAETGVDRISVGALTHSAPQLDVTLEWAT